MKFFVSKSDGLNGFTLVELLIVLAIVGILVGVTIPEIMSYIRESRYTRAIMDVKSFYSESLRMKASRGEFPSTWGDLGYSNPPVDPWGNAYVLNNHKDVNRGELRKDGPVVPINEYIDIYSKGPDGSSQPNIHSSSSKDDVILAAEGTFVGKAKDF